MALKDKDKDKSIYDLNDEIDSPLYSIEDEDLDEEEAMDDDPKKKNPSPLAILFKTMLTPVEGWKALKRAGFRTEEVAERCFYPLIALAAVTDVANMFYEAHYSFGNWAIDGLITFITFFFGYFTVLLFGGIILPKKSRDLMKSEIGRQFVMICMSTLAIFQSLINVIPMIEPVLVFLPIWTIYLIFKGVKILRVPKEVENSTIGYLCLLIIGAPILWNWLFSEYIIKIP